MSFNENASRSRDDSQGDANQSEDGENRLQRYQQPTLSEVSDPEFWMSLHHHGGNDDSEHDYEVEVEVKHPSFTEDVKFLVVSTVNLKVNHMVLYQLNDLMLVKMEMYNYFVNHHVIQLLSRRELGMR